MIRVVSGRYADRGGLPGLCAACHHGFGLFPYKAVIAAIAPNITPGKFVIIRGQSFFV